MRTTIITTLVVASVAATADASLPPDVGAHEEFVFEIGMSREPRREGPACQSPPSQGEYGQLLNARLPILPAAHQRQSDNRIRRGC